MRREEEIRRLIDESGTYIGEEMMSLTTTTMKPQPRRRKVKKPKLLAINTTLCKYDIVRECAKLMGYKDVDENEPWSMFWIDTGVSIERILEMDPVQKINHFPGMQEICRKDYLARNMARMSRLFPKEYNYAPKTWNVPSDWAEFKVVSNSSKKSIYIAKPDHGCQGKGIFLFKGIKDLITRYNEYLSAPPMGGGIGGGSSFSINSTTSTATSSTATATAASLRRPALLSENSIPTNMIIQQYIAKPYLIDGYKFDLRVYALVTSVDPLRIFVYEDGLARFATEKYEAPSSVNLKDVFMHLTNYAINKHSEKFDRNEQTGSKRTIKTVFKILEERGVDVDKLWGKIGEVIVKTLITIQPQLRKILLACFGHKSSSAANPSVGGAAAAEESAGDKKNEGSQCFEILGFDIFLDSKLKPWLLEVNHSPSFSCDSNLDLEVKRSVISDCMRLVSVDPKKADRFQKEQKEKTRTRLMQGIGGKNINSNNSIANDTISSATTTASSYTLSSTSSSLLSTTTQVTSSKIIKQDGTNNVINSTAAQSFESSSSSSNAATSIEQIPTNDASLKSRLPKRPKRLSSAEIKSKIQAYHNEYPASMLEDLEEYEDERIGGYKRIFPPPTQAKLAEYLSYMETADAIFGETLSSKGRKEYLKKKREEEAKKASQVEVWKQRAKNLYKSNTSLVDSRDGFDRADHPPNQSSYRFYSIHDPRRGGLGGGAPDGASKLNSNSSTSLKGSASDLKTPLKLNIESINMRFNESIIQQEFINRRLHENSPKAVITTSGSSSGSVSSSSRSSTTAATSFPFKTTAPLIMPMAFKSKLKKIRPQRSFPSASIPRSIEHIRLDVSDRNRVLENSANRETSAGLTRRLTTASASMPNVSGQQQTSSIRTDVSRFQVDLLEDFLPNPSPRKSLNLRMNHL